MNLYPWLALLLMAALLAGLVRVARGPSAADRMLGAQLLGSCTVGLLGLLAAAFDRPALLDVGLVFAVLALVAAVAFARRQATGRGRGS